MAKRVVLAYSGGLDTSVAVRWMIDNLGVEVIALAVDVGQAAEDYEVVQGAGPRPPAPSRPIVVDAKEEFAADYCAPALAGQRPLRGPLPAGVGAVAPGDRQAPRGRGPAARRRRRRPRLHRQGQRPGALRGVDPRPRPRPRGDRAGAGRGA